VGWAGDAARFELHSGPNLLIVPPQLMKNWVDEYEKNLDLKDTTFDWQLRTGHSLRLEEAKELEASDYGTVEYHQRRKRRGSIHFGKSLVRKDVRAKPRILSPQAETGWKRMERGKTTQA